MEVFISSMSSCVCRSIICSNAIPFLNHPNIHHFNEHNTAPSPPCSSLLAQIAFSSGMAMEEACSSRWTLNIFFFRPTHNSTVSPPMVLCPVSVVSSKLKMKVNLLLAALQRLQSLVCAPHFCVGVAGSMRFLTWDCHLCRMRG